MALNTRELVLGDFGLRLAILFIAFGFVMSLAPFFAYSQIVSLLLLVVGTVVAIYRLFFSDLQNVLTNISLGKIAAAGALIWMVLTGIAINLQIYSFIQKTYPDKINSLMDNYYTGSAILLTPVIIIIFLGLLKAQAEREDRTVYVEHTGEIDHYHHRAPKPRRIRNVWEY